MSLLRRRHLSPELEAVREAFLKAVEPVESAKEAVVAAVPQARFPGRELEGCLGEYESGLQAAAGRMAAWRHPALEPEWTACTRGLEKGLRRAAALRADEADLGFETLIEVVQELLDPLEVFATTEERFRDLRS